MLVHKQTLAKSRELISVKCDQDEPVKKFLWVM